MADGNRRPNYDGCLLPPTFIGPGEPYAKPETLNLENYFTRRSKKRNFYAGPMPCCGKCGRCGPNRLAEAVHTQELKNSRADVTQRVNARNGSKRGFRGGLRKTIDGCFSTTYDTTPCDRSRLQDRRSKSAVPGPRPGARAVMQQIGRGAGGVFPSVLRPLSTAPETSHGSRGAKGTGSSGKARAPWKGGAPPGDLLDANWGTGVQNTLVEGNDYFKKRQAPHRTMFRDGKNATGTIGKPYAHLDDPYTDEYIKYTKFGVYKPDPAGSTTAAGRIRGPGFYTYKNKTRTAFDRKAGLC